MEIDLKRILYRLLIFMITLTMSVSATANSDSAKNTTDPHHALSNELTSEKSFYTVDSLYGHFPIDKQASSYRRDTTISLTSREREFLSEHPIIRVAIDPDWYPMDFVDENGVHRGISADYLDRLSEIIGIRFKPDTDADWTTAMNRVKNRKLDMFAMAAATPERVEYASFTRPYIYSPMVIVTRDDQGFIDGETGLAGKLVGVAEGYASHEWLQSEKPEIQLMTFDTTVDGLNAVSNGRAYAFVDNLASISFLIKQQGLSNLKVSGQMPKSFDLAMGVRDDWPELVSILQKGLDAIPDEEKAEIYDRWIKLEFESRLNFSEVAPYFVALLLILLVVTFEMLRVHALKRKLRATNEQLLEAERRVTKKNQALELLSITDKLTGIYNRLKLDESLIEQHELAQRYDRPVSLIILDLDEFKKVNDMHGHQIGDKLLKAFAELIKKELRKSDIFGRWGGEEFMIICPETRQDEAVIIADKIHSQLRNQLLTAGIKQTASSGVSELSPRQTVTDWVSTCDINLYRAKALGRDRYEI